MRPVIEINTSVRRSKVQSILDRIVNMMTSQGMNLEDVAAKVGVTRKTLYVWRTDPSDTNIQGAIYALWKLGYEVEESVTIKTPKGEG